MFELVSKYQPSGDQPQAIEKLVNGIKSGEKHQVLLGVTGSGKTFTIANVIEKVNIPDVSVDVPLVKHLAIGEVAWFKFVAPETGKYKLEVWGAQGGTYSTSYASGGKGGYSYGTITLTDKSTTLYVYSGG
jgi:hypothetical protein